MSGLDISILKIAKMPQRVTTLLGVKITSKMNSAPSNYSECKFSAKFDNFKKITISRGFHNIWGVKMPPWGSQQTFWVQNTSKMKSAPSNYSECKFSAKSNNF